MTMRKQLWLLGVISAVVCLLTLILVGKNPYLFLFMIWGIASAALVLYGAKDFDIEK